MIKKRRLIFFSLITAFSLIFASFVTYRFFPGVIQKAHTYKRITDANLKKKLIKCGDTTFCYLEGGKKDGDDVLLIHGFKSDKSYKISYAKKLMDKYHVIIPDLPGHGETKSPKSQKYDLYSLSSSLTKFAKKKKIKSCHIIGASMGGGVATIFAHDNAKTVKSLTLINPLGILPTIQSEVQRQLEFGKNVFFPNTVQEFDELYVFLTGKPLVIANHFKEYALQHDLHGRDFFLKAFDQLVATKPLDSILPGIKTPTLILVGEKDQILHYSSIDVYKTKMPNAKGIIIKDGNHIFINEKFDIAAGSIKEFLKENE
jgi:abhydrolase domain-containing protein 6